MVLLELRQSGSPLLLVLKALRGPLEPLGRPDPRVTPETLAQPALRALQALPGLLEQRAHKVQPVLMAHHTVTLMVDCQIASMVASLVLTAEA